MRSGHSLNRKLLEALFADPTAWCFTTLMRGAAITEEAWREPVRVRA